MFESLVLSIKVLQKSKYGKGNKKRLAAISHALNRAMELFPEAKQNIEKNSESIEKISFRNIPQEEQIPKILEEFMNDFQEQCLAKNNASAKNYSLFSITCLKIIKTLDEGKKRGLLAAHAINSLDKMLTKFPVKYGKQAIRDPLGLVFAITELALDVEKNINRSYEFDETILIPLVLFLQRYYLQYDDSFSQILEDLADMPKFKMNIEIGNKHKEIIRKFLEYSIQKLSVEERVKKSQSILGIITAEEDDTRSMKYYEILKMTCSDKMIHPQLSALAKSIPKTSRRFANTILEELARL